MYLPGVSVRRVEDITEALWGTRVSPSTDAKIEAWRNRRIEGEHPYLYLDGIVMKRSWAGDVRTFRCWWPRPSIRKDFARSGDLRGRQGGQIRLVVPAAS